MLKEKVAEMTKRFAASGLMTDIDTDFRDGVTEVHVEPDREKAAASGVSVQDIADTINTAIGGVRQGYFTNGIRRYDVRMRLLPEQWRTTSDINKLLIRTELRRTDPALLRDAASPRRKSSSPSRARCASARSTSTPTPPRASRSTR